MADRKNWSKKDWEEQARKTEAELQRMQAELADANRHLAGAAAADPDSDASRNFPFHTLTAVIKQAIHDAHESAADQLAQAVAQIQIPAPQVTVQPAQQQQAAGGGAFKYKHMQDVKLLDVDSMTAADFKSWKQTWDDYYKVNQIENCPQDVRMAAFRLMCTVATRDKVVLMSPPADRVNDPSWFVNELEKLMVAKVNVVIERKKFTGRAQRSDESVGKYVLALRHLAKDADFGDRLDEMIKQQVSIHVKSTYVRNKIQELGTDGFNLSLEDFVKSVSAFERNEVEQEQMASGDFSSEAAAGKVSTYRDAKQRRDLEKIGVKGQSRSDNGSKKPSGKQCSYCGRVHTQGSCPAKGKDCHACGQPNHFSTVCRSKGGARPKKPSPNVKNLEGDESDSSVEGHIAHLMAVAGSVATVIPRKIKHVKCQVSFGKRAPVPVYFIPDTGCEIDCISVTLVKRLGLLSQLMATDLQLKGPDNSQVGFLGCVSLNIRRNKSVLRNRHCIVLRDCTPLLSLDSCVKLGLISEDFPDCDMSSSDKDNTHMECEPGLTAEDVEGVVGAVSPRRLESLQQDGLMAEVHPRGA